MIIFPRHCCIVSIYRLNPTKIQFNATFHRKVGKPEVTGVVVRAHAHWQGQGG